MGSMWRRRFSPARSSQRVTVRTLIWVPRAWSSWVMRRADNLWVRRQVLDEVDDLRRGLGGAVPAGAGAVLQAGLAMDPVAGHPLGHGGARDAGLGGDVGDGAGGLDALDQAQASSGRERGVTVGHRRRGPLSQIGCFTTTHPDPDGPHRPIRPQRLQPHCPQHLGRSRGAGPRAGRPPGRGRRARSPSSCPAPSCRTGRGRVGGSWSCSAPSSSARLTRNWPVAAGPMPPTTPMTALSKVWGANMEVMSLRLSQGDCGDREAQ